MVIGEHDGFFSTLNILIPKSQPL